PSREIIRDETCTCEPCLVHGKKRKLQQSKNAPESPLQFTIREAHELYADSDKSETESEEEG
uniref:Uncharacterized protein n=1 Tax=Romanomermis culicivorax TaxID=13658 RepID=A0A915JRZ7_ROMCU